MSKHTLTPWRVEQDTTLIWGACDPDDRSDYGMGYPIADCRITPTSMSWAKGPNADEGEANAEMIVKAVNSHASLIEALAEIRQIITDARGSIAQILDVVDKALGEPNP